MRILFVPYFLFSIFQLFGQAFEQPTHASGQIKGNIKIDGRLDEPDWGKAPVLSNFLTIEPVEKGTPSFATNVRVLTDEKSVIIGIECKDNAPYEIVKFSKLRDADISNEDHVKIVIDPFMDGQSGYILAVNAFAARYDALVSNRGESENEDWDAVWEARVSIIDNGWTVEILIPIQSIAFKKGLKEWGFNVERRIQRNQETIRWANVQRDQWFIQTSRAGILTGLPTFNYGIGLNARPSVVIRSDKFSNGEDSKVDFETSLDASQRLSPKKNTITPHNLRF